MSEMAQLRVNLVCDADGCWQPALMVARKEGRIVCFGHALGVLD